MQDAWKDGLTRLDKLKASLRSRLPPSWTEVDRASFVDKVDMTVTGAWTMFQPAVSTPVASTGGMVPQPVASAGMVPQPVASAGMVPQPVATMVPTAPTMVPQPPLGPL